MASVILSLLPGSPRRWRGWEWRRLAAFAREVSERAGAQGLPVLSVTKHRGIVRADDYFRKAVHGRDTSNYKVVRKGQFAYATIHLDEGSIGLLESEAAGIVSPMYTVFELTSDTDPRYLLAALKRTESLATYRVLAQGTVNRRASISFDTLASVHVLCPPPAEQRKIAAILSSVDEAIEKTQAVIDQVQVVKKGLMQELLTRGLPGRHKRFKKKTDIGEIPEEWSVVSLQSVAMVLGGRASKTGGSWLRVFKTRHVYDGPLRLDDPQYVPDELASKVPRSTFLCAGDTLTPNMGHGTISRVAYVDHPDASWTVDGQVTIIRVANASLLTSRYLYEWLSSEKGKRQLLDREVGSEFDRLRGQTHLYPRDIATIRIALPPLDEQSEVASRLAAVHTRMWSEGHALTQLKATKRALASILLSGEVRVKPDPEAAA